MLQAFLHLARAKYSMGVHRVSSANFDAHLEASTLISVSKDPPSFSLLPPGKGVLKRSMHEPEQATGEACEEARCPEDSAGAPCIGSSMICILHIAMLSDACCVHAQAPSRHHNQQASSRSTATA